VRRLALLAVAALACRGNTANTTPGPLDRFFYPTGLAVLPVAPGGEHRLVVVSSNADLTYASDTGGSVISVDPEAKPVAVTGAVDIRTFGGELALASPAACPALPARAGSSEVPGAAVIPIRGEDVVHLLDVGAQGGISCGDPSGCVLSVGSAQRGDPWSAGVACDAGYARAYVGYLREAGGTAWLTQIDLTKQPPEVQHGTFGNGQIRGIAYDTSRRRLYLARTVVGAGTSLAYVDLANGCRIDATYAEGGCPNGSTPVRTNPSVAVPGEVPYGVELRSIALAHETGPASSVRRAYVTGRIYDPVATAQAGGRVGDFDGLLLVVNLSENAAGVLQFDVVNEIPIGYGAADVRVLPQRFDATTGAPRRDVVAALAADDGAVWIYDDETGSSVAIGRDPDTGAPRVGRAPHGLAVAPEVLPGKPVPTARVYVGSFEESFVTAIDVPLDHPESIAADPGAAMRRIFPGAP
jgi:hypothetical protein